jgi:hypothetical protein
MTLGTFHGPFTLPDARILSQVDRPINHEAGPLNCAQSAPKNIGRNQKIPEKIEKYRSPEGPEKPVFTGEIVYFLRVKFAVASYTR